MRSILYIIAVVLIIAWLLGMTGTINLFGGGGLIHILLVLAIISLLLGFIRRGSV